ncbi:hypothetical protein Tco_0784217 [Tanacetum coccineum]
MLCANTSPRPPRIISPVAAALGKHDREGGRIGGSASSERRLRKERRRGTVCAELTHRVSMICMRVRLFLVVEVRSELAE